MNGSLKGNINGNYAMRKEIRQKTLVPLSKEVKNIGQNQFTSEKLKIKKKFSDKSLKQDFTSDHDRERSNSKNSKNVDDLGRRPSKCIIIFY